jgi:molecular chaperone DnaJ
VLRVKGRGVVTPKGTGDLLARIEVAVPSHLTAKQREAIEAFAAASSDENPREDLLAKAGSR